MAVILTGLGLQFSAPVFYAAGGVLMTVAVALGLYAPKRRAKRSPLNLDAEGDMKVPVADTRLTEAILYSITGNWGGNINTADAKADEITDAVERFRQMAFDGKILVWGEKVQARGLMHPIPKTAWEANDVHEADLFADEARTYMRTINGRDAGFVKLRVSRDQWRRAGLRIKRIPA